MNAKILSVLVCSLLLLVSCLPVVAEDDPFDETVQVDPLDWPHWRGPEMNGISREKDLVDRWSPRGENLLWKREELGGRSTPIVMNGKLYLIVRDLPETKFEGEKVVCIDAVSGEPQWENRFGVFLSDVPDTRVGWSSVAGDPATGQVFALGVCGYFQCMDGESGKTLWSHSLSEEYGLLSTYGGRTNFPIIHGNLVIISAIVIGWGEMAKPAHRFIAFDKRNGQPVWFEGTRLLPYDTTYSSPVKTVINGQEMMIFGSGDGGIHAFQPRTGKSIWNYNVSRRGINTTPLVVGTTVFAGHSEENLDGNRMGALFAIDASLTGDISKTGELWRVREWFVGKSSPVHVDGRLYAVEDKGTLLIVDANSSKRIASVRLRGPMRSSPLYADGKLYIFTRNGIWWTFKPTEEGVEEVHRERMNAGESHGSPIVSHGRIYVPTTEALYCIGKPDQVPSADPIPPRPQETPLEADEEPAHLQVVPVESLLRPSFKQQFDVRMYNANGQFVRMASADEIEVSVDGPGVIEKASAPGSDAGEVTWYYTTPSENEHASVKITANVGDLVGTARVRVVPKLPWSFDFSDGQIPVTWVGARYRHVVVDYDLFDSLNQQNELAAQLYLYLMTGFTNSGRSTLTYDDSTPRLAWTEFLRFLDLLERATTFASAVELLEPVLTQLKEEQVLASWEFNELDGKGTQLIVQRGSRQITGNGVMLKVTTIPKGKRSQGWMGHPDLHDYTIQADVLGAVKNNKMPDIGLISQRYAIDLMGASQQLQIRTWHPQLRMASTVPTAWKPNVWYTLKLKASVEKDKAVLRGKVWPRNDQEPADWMIEAVDERPNVIGSPGLFGNATDAEIFYDNIRIYKN